MKDIYLHVGLEKTGTTAIQHVLSTERGKLAEHYNAYLGPDGVHSVTLHHRIAKSFINPQIAAHHQPLTDEEFDAVLADFDARGAERMIISSELFCYADDAQVTRVRERLAGRSVKVVVFLRPQDQYFTSQYLQSLKGVWRMGRVPTELGRFQTHNMDYDAFVQRWEKVFGIDNVALAIYGDDAHPTIFDHFLDIVTEGQHRPGAIEYPSATINPGLSAVHQAIVAEDLKHLDRPADQAAIEALTIAHSDAYLRNLDPSQKHGLLPQAKRQQILADAAASNASLARRYFDRETLFAEDQHAQATRDADLSDFRKVYVDLVASALRQNAPHLPRSSVAPSRPVLYIGGTGRSGTTTLINILSSLPQFASFKGLELKLFSAPGGLAGLKHDLVDSYNFGRATRALRDFTALWTKVCGGSAFNQVGLDQFVSAHQLDEMRDDFLNGLMQEGVPVPCEAETFLGHATGLLNAMMATITTDDTAYFIEKTPHNLLDLPLLEGVSPGAKYIHILRDPMLTALSIGRQSWGPSEPAETVAYVAGYLERWSRIKEDMTGTHGLDILDITLEDVLVDRPGVAARMAQYLQCDVEDALLTGLGDFSLERQLEDMATYERERRALYEIAPPIMQRAADIAESKLRSKT